MDRDPCDLLPANNVECSELPCGRCSLAGSTPANGFTLQALRGGSRGSIHGRQCEHRSLTFNLAEDAERDTSIAGDVDCCALQVCLGGQCVLFGG